MALRVHERCCLAAVGSGGAHSATSAGYARAWRRTGTGVLEEAPGGRNTVKFMGVRVAVLACVSCRTMPPKQRLSLRTVAIAAHCVGCWAHFAAALTCAWLCATLNRARVNSAEAA